MPGRPVQDWDWPEDIDIPLAPLAPAALAEKVEASAYDLIAKLGLELMGQALDALELADACLRGKVHSEVEYGEWACSPDCPMCNKGTGAEL